MGYKEKRCPECGGAVTEAPAYDTFSESYESVCRNCGLILSEPHKLGEGEPINPPVKFCKECGDSFRPKKGWHVYCSNRCNMRAARKRWKNSLFWANLTPVRQP
jgi:hypothetical protein